MAAKEIPVKKYVVRPSNEGREPPMGRARWTLRLLAGCDYEYERNGTANIFMMFAPLEGWRHVKVTDRHTAAD
jgi:hypothetical protein